MTQLTAETFGRCLCSAARWASTKGSGSTHPVAGFVSGNQVDAFFCVTCVISVDLEFRVSKFAFTTSTMYLAKIEFRVDRECGFSFAVIAENGRTWVKQRANGKGNG